LGGLGAQGGLQMDRDWLTLGWKMLLVRGAIGIVFGILAIVWPIETAIAFALLWGIWALADGIGSIVQAFQPESKGNRVWLVVLGVIALRVEGKIEWDSAKMRITNNTQANKYLKPTFRKGWSLA